MGVTRLKWVCDEGQMLNLILYGQSAAGAVQGQASGEHNEGMCSLVDKSTGF